jgi:hypothetical protein
VLKDIRSLAPQCAPMPVPRHVRMAQRPRPTQTPPPLIALPGISPASRHPHENETRVTGDPRSPEVLPSVWDRTIASMRTQRRVPRRSLFPRRGLLLRRTPAARWPAHRSPQGRHRQLSTLSQPSPVPLSIEPTLLLRPADSQPSESEVVDGVPESDTNPLGTDVRNGAPRRTHRETHPRRGDKGGEPVRVRQSLRKARTGSVIDEPADLDTLNRPESL